MRTRITYVVEDVQQPHHAELIDNGDAFEVKDLPALKHVRIVVPGARPVSPAVAQKGYVAWARQRLFATPFESPVELGLHADMPSNSNWPELVSWLKSLGVQLDSDATVPGPNWDSWTGPGHLQIDGLEDADAIKITFGYAGDTLPGVSNDDLIIEGWWTPQTWTENLKLKGNKTEVGVISLEPKASDAYDSTFHGYTTILGRDARPTPVMLHYKRSYFQAHARVTGDFGSAYGLHPVYYLNLDVDDAPACKLYAQLDLPASVFIDKYQLEDLPLMNPPLELLGVWGETDLEKPIWQVNQGSLALFRLDGKGNNETYAIPMHFRYEHPSQRTHAHEILPSPLLFWACEQDHSGHVSGLGFESIFPKNTVYHFAETRDFAFKVPVIDLAPRAFVYSATSLTVLLGTLIIVFMVLRQSVRKFKTD